MEQRKDTMLNDTQHDNTHYIYTHLAQWNWYIYLSLLIVMFGDTGLTDTQHNKTQYNNS
jgi:hypothetical protein